MINFLVQERVQLRCKKIQNFPCICSAVCRWKLYSFRRKLFELSLSQTGLQPYGVTLVEEWPESVPANSLLTIFLLNSLKKNFTIGNIICRTLLTRLLEAKSRKTFTKFIRHKISYLVSVGMKCITGKYN